MSNTKLSSYLDLEHFPYKDIFNDVLNAWDALPQIESYLENLFKSGRIKANYKDSENIYIGENVIIESNVEIQGPAIIGDNSHLAHASYLRGGCILGNNVKIGHGSEIKHSIFLNDSVSAHLNYVGDSIIGSRVNISGGAILANWRLDEKEIYVTIDGEKINTTLTKFGALVGDGSKIGVNSVLNPGTILGKNTVVYPLISVLGTHPSESILKKM